MEATVRSAAEEAPEVAAAEEPITRAGPTADQVLAIKAAIVNASTLEEVSALEEALKTGQLPSALGNGSAAAMEEG